MLLETTAIDAISKRRQSLHSWVECNYEKHCGAKKCLLFLERQQEYPKWTFAWQYERQTQRFQICTDWERIVTQMKSTKQTLMPCRTTPKNSCQRNSKKIN